MAKVKQIRMLLLPFAIFGIMFFNTMLNVDWLNNSDNNYSNVVHKSYIEETASDSSIFILG